MLIYLCLGAGLFYSIMTRFVQIRHFSEMWRLLLSGKKFFKGDFVIPGTCGITVWSCWYW
ncbi:hypothetical protein QW180_05090 [Vibrio sinaloensis]|nr:hypothetical protein [Vibrio sinaloensis]